MHGNVWVFIEQRNSQIQRVSLELLGGGRKLADKLECKLAAIILDENAEKHAQTLISYGADVVYAISHPILKLYQSLPYAQIIAKLAKEKKPEILLIGATAIGMDLAPRIAAKLRTGLSAHVTELRVNKSGLLEQIVPGFGGNVMAVVTCPERRPQMATVRPGIFSLPTPNPNRTGETIRIEPQIDEPLRAKTIEIKQEKPPEKPIEEAEIVVAGGWGMKFAGGFEPIRKLASILNAAVGGTRPALDEGWIKEDQMIGQSGKTIKPKLYIGIGISGEMHHTVGILDSKCIVAINNDPDAPIFRVADIGVIGNAEEILPHLIKELQRLTQST